MISDAFLNTVRTIISIVAYFLIIFGLGYLFAPKLIDEISKSVNKMLIPTDSWVSSHRALTGVMFVVIAFILLFLINLKVTF